MFGCEGSGQTRRCFWHPRRIELPDRFTLRRERCRSGDGGGRLSSLTRNDGGFLRQVQRVRTRESRRGVRRGRVAKLGWMGVLLMAGMAEAQVVLPVPVPSPVVPFGQTEGPATTPRQNAGSGDLQIGNVGPGLTT